MVAAHADDYHSQRPGFFEQLGKFLLGKEIDHRLRAGDGGSNAGVLIKRPTFAEEVSGRRL